MLEQGDRHGTARLPVFLFSKRSNSVCRLSVYRFWTGVGVRFFGDVERGAALNLLVHDFRQLELDAASKTVGRKHRNVNAADFRLIRRPDQIPTMS